MKSKKIIFLFFLTTQISNCQTIKIYGNVYSNNQNGIEGCSIILFDEFKEVLAFSYTDSLGKYEFQLDKIPSDKLIFQILHLDYASITDTVIIKKDVFLERNFKLKEELKTFNEVLIIGKSRIWALNDTTTIKVNGFTNNSEQTVEDVLKRLPGIEVLKDGTIKAHNKTIEKLMIEGEDFLDKNYKIISKNLDAKRLDMVQIIDHFEENAILKKVVRSEKVALNLKLTKSNVLFGNGQGSLGTNQRFKEALNLGLISKKIKALYFGDFNNLGEKSTELIENNYNNENRIEYKSQNQYNILPVNLSFFNQTQSINNKATLNSMAFSKRISNITKIRGSIFHSTDNQNQFVNTITNYFSENQNINYSESNHFNIFKKISSAEIELKSNKPNKYYLENLFVLKNNNSMNINNLIFNQTPVNQSNKGKNISFANHFNHTIQLSNNKILQNYIYFGIDNLKNNISIGSSILNNYLKLDSTLILQTKQINKIKYGGIKSKLITIINKFVFTQFIQIEANITQFGSNFTNSEKNLGIYENTLVRSQIKSVFGNNLLYRFSNNSYFMVDLDFQKSNVNIYDEKTNKLVILPKIYFDFRLPRIGKFSCNYMLNSDFADVGQQIRNPQLINYRAFNQGIIYSKPIKTHNLGIYHQYYNDERRFSLSSEISYFKVENIINSKNVISENFSFIHFIPTKGNTSINYRISLVNYLKKIKTATKLEFSGSKIGNFVNFNSDDFIKANGFVNTYKFSFTTYFKSSINFDSGVNLNTFLSEYQGVKSNYVLKDAFVNVIVNFKERLNATFTNNFYIIDSQNYSFNNILLNYTPTKSKFSYKIQFNNVLNQNTYIKQNLENNLYSKSTIRIVPRYILLGLRYRF